MLDEDEITAAENAFMQGRDMTPDKKKHPTHNDTVSVELAEEEYEEDQSGCAKINPKGIV
jgi:hypothetical protein